MSGKYRSRGISTHLEQTTEKHELSSQEIAFAELPPPPKHRVNNVARINRDLRNTYPLVYTPKN